MRLETADCGDHRCSLMNAGTTIKAQARTSFRVVLYQQVHVLSAFVLGKGNYYRLGEFFL